MDLDEHIAQATELLRKLRWRSEAREAGLRSARRDSGGRYRPAVSGNREIAHRAILIQPVPGDPTVEFWVTYTPLREEWLRLREDPRTRDLIGEHCNPDALNGYVAFPKRHAPRLKMGSGNIVQYIPVHGGITYMEKDSVAAVWGFDTQHLSSEKEPIAEPEWVVANCWILYRGLKLAAKLWPEFRRAGNMRRAELAQQLLDLVEEQPLGDKLGFEAMLSVLTGRIG